MQPIRKKLTGKGIVLIGLSMAKIADYAGDKMMANIPQEKPSMPARFIKKTTNSFIKTPVDVPLNICKTYDCLYSNRESIKHYFPNPLDET